ncbi:MAG: imidazole glycerol phosphate synthase, glutamine amidotransferase subunit [Nitrospirae bacterium RIFCSPLOWO2_12_FULL_63_8]|nr:MAG: imidazole glycerol phosphate synthase, glutamine amidotransferase subunit [Nitrospirae bacterium RIFCSPLOWO2_12_FULL_63_8]
MIAIIDYGMGNLRSVQKAFETVGHRAVVTRDPRAIADASHVVLPGVGAFADCMANLEQYGLVEPIWKTIASGKPFLGICLGLQLLFTESEEFGLHKGLGVLPGRVKKFPWGLAPDRVPVPRLKVPHMGWNGVTVTREAPPLRGIASGEHVYFVHSYYVEPQDRSVVATTTDYGLPFASSVWRDNIFACQFHPEKSQATGLRIVKNFGEWS